MLPYKEIFRKVQNAVKKENVALINKIVTRENVNTADWTRNTFLHFVAEHGTVEIANQFLKLGSDVNISNIDGNTPIFYAIRNSVEMVRTLVDEKTIIDSKVLHRALFFGTEEIVRLLLQNKKKVPECSENPSLSANSSKSKSGNQEPDELDTKSLMKVLLHDSQFSWQKKEHYPLLIFFAAKCGKKIALQLVLDEYRKYFPKNEKETKKRSRYREEVNVPTYTGETALHYAVSLQHIDAVRFLLDQGADPNCKNTSKWTPLYYAARLENRKICELLLSFGAKVHPDENKNKINPFHLVCGFPLGQFFHSFDKFTIEIFSHFKSQSIFNNEIMRLLLEKGAHPNRGVRVRGNDEVPLFRACKAERFEEVKTLFEFGANVQVLDSHENTALHHATNNSSIEIVKLLLENGLDINAKNKYDDTPLMFAMRGKDHSGKHQFKDPTLEMIQYLVDHGSNLSAESPANETAFDIAMSCKRSKVILTLLELEADRMLKRNSDSENRYSARDHCNVSEVAREILVSYIALKADDINDYSSCYLNPNKKEEAILIFDKSKLELEKLKARKFLKNVEGCYSYYDFLAQDLPTAMRIFKNPAMRKELLKRGNDFQKFDYFKHFLEHRLELVQDLENCFDKVVDFFLNYGKVRLTLVVIEMILSYFSWRDFKLFGRALSQVEY